MVGKSEAFGLVFIVSFFLIVRFEKIIIFVGFWRSIFVRFLRWFRRIFYFVGRLVVGVDNGGDFAEDGVKVGPWVGFFFGEDDSGIEANLERADLWVDYIFVGVGVDILVLCDFEWDKMGWHHVPNDFEVWVALG